jgi:hypothetical protein
MTYDLETLIPDAVSPTWVIVHGTPPASPRSRSLFARTGCQGSPGSRERARHSNNSAARRRKVAAAGWSPSTNSSCAVRQSWRATSRGASSSRSLVGTDQKKWRARLPTGSTADANSAVSQAKKHQGDAFTGIPRDNTTCTKYNVNVVFRTWSRWSSRMSGWPGTTA